MPQEEMKMTEGHNMMASMTHGASNPMPQTGSMADQHNQKTTQTVGPDVRVEAESARAATEAANLRASLTG